MRSREELSGLLSRVRSSRFVRHVAILASGSAIAQAITLIATPALTRIYSPADYGVLALFMALVSSVTPAICGRFEVALVVAKSEVRGRRLLGLALSVAFSVSATALAALLILRDGIVRLLNATSLGGWLLVIPVALFLNGATAALTYYANRRREYTVISTSLLVQNLVGVGSSLGLGLLGFGAGGLLAGMLTGWAVATVWLLVRYRHELTWASLRWSPRQRALVRRYREFPIYNASTALLNGIHLALPVFFIARYFPDSIVGYYGLIIRVVQAPLALVSTAVLQVNLKKVTELIHENTPIRPYLKRLTAVLAAIVAPLAVVIVFAAPSIFTWAFGAQWTEAGVYAQILAPALALRFVVSTVSSTFGATGHNRLAAAWKVTALVVTACMYLFVAPGLEIKELFVAIVLTEVSLNVLHYAFIWRAAGRPRIYR